MRQADPSLRPAWSTESWSTVPGQPGRHRETLSEKKRKEKKRREKVRLDERLRALVASTEVGVQSSAAT